LTGKLIERRVVTTAVTNSQVAAVDQAGDAVAHGAVADAKTFGECRL
jgi:hypothetical protein